MSEAQLVREAWAEAERLREFIRSLEWSGTAVVDYDGVTAVCCPACCNLKPGEISGWSNGPYGHAADCKLVAALQPGIAPKDGG